MQMNLELIVNASSIRIEREKDDWNERGRLSRLVRRFDISRIVIASIHFESRSVTEHRSQRYRATIRARSVSAVVIAYLKVSEILTREESASEVFRRNANAACAISIMRYHDSRTDDPLLRARRPLKSSPHTSSCNDGAINARSSSDQALFPHVEAEMALFRGLFDFFLNDNKLDEKLGLTEKQKRLVQNTWAIVRKDEVSIGVALVLAYFKQYPEYQNEFKSFKDVPLDELSKNKRFQAHCANIVATLGKAIEQMHDPELMEASLINLTEKHKNRGQTPIQFENLKQVMLDLFPSLFGKQYTAEVQEAWKKTLDLVFSKICQVLSD